MNRKLILPIIVAAQFCGTSLWFAGNAALSQLQDVYQWPVSAVGYLTSSVQLGFILGTLALAITGVSDKFSPSKIFLISSIAGAGCNLISLLVPSSFYLILLSRGLVGICLAGIYPVGMKIAADWNETGLGKWLGALVGAVVLGTSFPHALKLLPELGSSSALLFSVSIIAMLGGVLLYLFVQDGPYRKGATAFSFTAIQKAFKFQPFRAPSLGYFGHMWELYAWWTFIPSIIISYNMLNQTTLNESLFAFVFIASGSVGCFMGGIFSGKFGSGRIATGSLIVSGICCLVSPVLWTFTPLVFIGFMMLWGFTVVSDSPQFSALVAGNAAPEIRGSAITLITCIGFFISIVSIYLISSLIELAGSYYLLILVPGPILGILSMLKNKK